MGHFKNFLFQLREISRVERESSILPSLLFSCFFKRQITAKRERRAKKKSQSVLGAIQESRQVISRKSARARERQKNRFVTRIWENEERREKKSHFPSIDPLPPLLLHLLTYRNEE